MDGNATLPYFTGYQNLSDGISMFYREAGNPANPTVLLLHGWPSSSHQFRNLIPLLALMYHVIAPDYPGFGFTTVPSALNYTYNFDNLAGSVSEFLKLKNVTTFTPYVFDYGAPVGFRLMLENPTAAKAIITQNGNAYVEGFDGPGQEYWAPVFARWNATTEAEIQAADTILIGTYDYNGILTQYTVGSPDPSVIAPESYLTDYYLISQPGNYDIQISLENDYQNNVKAYPKWHAWMREYQPKILAIWGKNDVVFTPPGAEAFKQDVPDTEVVFLDAGHFPLETNLTLMADNILTFLASANLTA